MCVCPLCSSSGASIFFKDRRRSYFLCDCCALIFVPSEFHLSEGEEMARYNQHNNCIDDLGYVEFLNGAVEAVGRFVDVGACGLDFGCGKGAVLAQLLRERGFCVDVYDPFYFKDFVFDGKLFDFVTATEVVEHFCFPRREFELIASLLKKGAFFVVMTNLYDGIDFSSWWYKEDATHVCFYGKRSLEVLASLYGFRLLEFGNVSVFQRC